MDITRFLPNDEYLAAIGANSPSASNVFATMNDLSGFLTSESDTLQTVLDRGSSATLTTGTPVQLISESVAPEGTEFYQDDLTTYISATDTGSGVSKFEIDTTSGFSISDGINSKGLVYNADYSAAGTGDDRWLPDYGAVKAYADTKNGIYSGSDSLSGNTTVAQAANTLAFTGSVVDMFNVASNSLSVDGLNNRVGIGTASPLRSLDVRTTTGVPVIVDGQNSGTAITNISGVFLSNSDSTDGNWAGFGFSNAINGAGKTTIATQFDRVNDSTILAFATTNLSSFSEKARITSDGNLAVGDTAALARIHSKGSGTTSATSNLYTENSANTELFRVRDNGVVEAAALTTALIDAGIARTLVTKEYLSTGVGGIYGGSGSLTASTTTVTMGGNQLIFSGSSSTTEVDSAGNLFVNGGNSLLSVGEATEVPNGAVRVTMASSGGVTWGRLLGRVGTAASPNELLFDIKGNTARAFEMGMYYQNTKQSTLTTTSTGIEFRNSSSLDVLRILDTGVLEAPEMSIAEIDAGGNSTLTTKEWVNQAYTTGQTYTPTNVTTDRSYDANSTTIDEIADVVGTLINDLQGVGILG